MAGTKGKSGRNKKYPNETPEERKERIKANNRNYQREYYHKKKKELEELRLKAIEEKFNNEITGGM